MARELPSALSDLEEIAQFAEIRLIAFDLDGTLLKTPDGIPGERIKRLQRSSKAAGVKTTIATGRTLWGARAVIEAFGGLGDIPVVLYNGSIVVQPGTQNVVRSVSIPIEAIPRILDAAKAFDASAFLYRFDPELLTSWPVTKWPEKVLFVGDRADPAKEFNGMPVERADAASLLQLNANYAAILVLTAGAEEAKLLTTALNDVPGVSVTTSGGPYIEVRPAGSSKAIGVAHLAQRLGILQHEVLAVGDNDNDVELLDWAGIGVSVAGASLAARSAASHYSKHGAERAAIEILDLVRLVKRLNKGRSITHHAN